MAREVRHYAVTVPAGTPVATPQVSDLTMPARIVTEIRVRVPPGPRGEVGFAIGAAGVPVIPWNAGAWVIADDETIDWPLDDQIESGAWQLIAYNTGAYAHTLYVMFLLDIPGAGTVPAASVPLSPAALVTALPAPSVPATTTTTTTTIATTTMPLPEIPVVGTGASTGVIPPAVVQPPAEVPGPALPPPPLPGPPPVQGDNRINLERNAVTALAAGARFLLWGGQLWILYAVDAAGNRLAGAPPISAGGYYIVPSGQSWTDVLAQVARWGYGAVVMGGRVYKV